MAAGFGVVSGMTTSPAPLGLAGVTIPATDAILTLGMFAKNTGSGPEKANAGVVPEDLSIV